MSNNVIIAYTWRLSAKEHKILVILSVTEYYACFRISYSIRCLGRVFMSQSEPFDLQQKPATVVSILPVLGVLPHCSRISNNPTSAFSDPGNP